MLFPSSVMCFLETARKQNITHAAEALYMSRQAVSKQIMRLEDELGTALLDRSGGKLTITAAGRLYYEFYTAMLDRWKALQAEVRALSGREKLIRIGFLKGVNIEEQTFQLIDECARADGSLRFIWERLEPFELAEGLLSGRLDIIFSFEPELRSVGIEKQTFIQSRFCVVISEMHPRFDSIEKLSDFESCCRLKSNGWGVISVDGPIQTRMLLKDTSMELSGPRARGYGAFIFGDCKAEFDHCNINVNGYPLLINTERDAVAKVTNGTVITAPLYGTMFFRDEGGTLIMDKGSVINSRQACLVFKASNSFCYLDDVSLNAENGIICQMMDNDDPGVMVDHFCPPVGETDTPIAGRDLTAGDKTRDVFLYISNSQLKGDFLNSSTNLKANCRVAGNTHFDLNDDALNATIGESLSVSQELVYQDDETQGAKNLVIELTTPLSSALSARHLRDITTA